MEEFPNLSYVEEIAGTDYDFAKRFVSLFKEEFSWEVGMYLHYLKKDKPRAAAEIVGQSKHKFSVLGLQNAFSLANKHELKLHQGNTELDDEFRKILIAVLAFLKKN